MVINNYKVHHIFQIFQNFNLKCYNTWKYNMPHTCGKKIQISHKQCVHNTNFLDCDPWITYITKSIFHWILMLVV
jgi:hypothetical protein